MCKRRRQLAASQARLLVFRKLLADVLVVGMCRKEEGVLMHLLACSGGGRDTLLLHAGRAPL